jgi:hypothetical protein
MRNQFKFYSLIAAVLIAVSSFLNSCKPDEHNHGDEHDAIVKIQLVFTDSATNTAAGTFTWSDPDGIGGNNPTQIDTIQLNASKVYNAALMVYTLHDGTHEQNITADILAEKNDHLFVFKNIAGNLSVEATDKDDNNFPIGVESRWVTGAASIGSVNILLRHQPGVKDGSETPGDTDVDVTFPVNIQ